MTFKLKHDRALCSLVGVSGAAILLLTANAQGRTRLSSALCPASSLSTSSGEIVAERGATEGTTSDPTALELSNIRQLTFAHGEEENVWPSWSPDSRKLVFQKIIPGYSSTHLFIMNAADGSGVTQLTNDRAPDTQPAWSPKGDKIAFVRKVNTGGQWTGQICTINVDGTGFQQLTRSTSPSECLCPTWSNRGRLIAFTRVGDPSIHAINIEDGAEFALTPASAPGPLRTFDGSPAWSPDGKSLAFQRVNFVGGDLYIRSADGERKLTNFKYLKAYRISWSPDGRYIVFGYNNVIWLVLPDGAGLTKLPLNGLTITDRGPAWSPDGKTIAFERRKDPQGVLVAGSDFKSQIFTVSVK